MVGPDAAGKLYIIIKVTGCLAQGGAARRTTEQDYW